jgi:hypothetical protein
MYIQENSLDECMTVWYLTSPVQYKNNVWSHIKYSTQTKHILFQSVCYKVSHDSGAGHDVALPQHKRLHWCNSIKKIKWVQIWRMWRPDSQTLTADPCVWKMVVQRVMHLACCHTETTFPCKHWVHSAVKGKLFFQANHCTVWSAIICGPGR